MRNSQLCRHRGCIHCFPRSSACEGLIERASRLDTLKQTDSALDLLYDGIDDKLRNGEFEDVDRMLSRLKAVQLSADMLLGVLTATLPAKTKLPSRKKLLMTTETVLRNRGEYEDGLLAGL